MKIRFYKVSKAYGTYDFVDYDTDKGVFYTGNTASTGQSLIWDDVRVEVKSVKELDQLTQALELQHVENGGRL